MKTRLAGQFMSSYSYRTAVIKEHLDGDCHKKDYNN